MTYPILARAAATLAVHRVRPDANIIGEPEDLGLQWAFRWGVGSDPFLDSPMVVVDKDSLEVTFE